MNLNNYQTHTGRVVKKRRDFFGRCCLILDTGTEKVTVIVGKGFFDATETGSVLMVGHIGKQLINIRKTALSAEAKIWNRFIDEFCDRPIEELTPLQRNAVLPYWYDCEINSDGHADYVPLCNADSRDALARCLKEIGAEDFAANFLSACASGAQDDYSRADHWFGNRKPTLTSIMMAYVLEHAGGIFD